MAHTTATLHYLSGNERQRAPLTRRCRTDEEYVAIRRSIRTWFGPRARWFANHELPGYGQVVEPVRGNPGCCRCITNQVRLDVEVST